MSSRLRPYWPLALLLAVRLVVALMHSVFNPPWESYDETGHFQYARYLAKHRVPVLQPGDPEAEVIWSKFQPPLYYITLLPALIGFDFGEQFVFPAVNPYLASGRAGVNYALPPTPADLAGLPGVQITALYVARVFGAVLSTASVLFMYFIARRLWPGQPAAVWGVTAVYAFWPQFLFIGSMVTNDLLITSLAPPILLLALKSVQEGLRPAQLGVLGLLVVAAILTKLNGLAFLPVAVVALLGSPVYGRRLKLGLVAAGLALVGLVGIGGLTSLRFVTDQVFQLETLLRFFRNLNAENASAPSGPQASWLLYGFRTFVASYGWGNVESFGWWYTFWEAAWLTAGAGLVYQLARRRTLPAQPGVVVLMLSLPISLLGLSYALAIAQSDRFLVVGRYLLPGLPAAAVLLGWGWEALTAERYRAWLWRGLGLGLAGMGALTPVLVIAPTYARPQPLSAEASAALPATPVARLGDHLMLLGQVAVAAGQPEGELTLRLCWMAAAPIDQHYPLRLNLIGPDGQGYGQLETYPGRGNFPTGLWTPGERFCDVYYLPVRGDFPAPAEGRVRVSFLDPATNAPLPAVDAAGAALETVTVPVVVRAAQAPTPPAVATEYEFGAVARLRGYTLTPNSDQTGVTVELLWEALAAPGRAYKVFAHLRTATPGQYTQSDQSPRGNRYPTVYWTAGERVADAHVLSLPPGAAWSEVKLYVGMYDAETGQRLPIRDGAGQPVVNNELVLPLP